MFEIQRCFSVEAQRRRGGLAMLWNTKEEVEDSSLPWCLLGDFNNMVSQADKRSGRPYPSLLVEGFQKTLSDCNLVDIDLYGHQFTWERGRGTDRWVKNSALLEPISMEEVKGALFGMHPDKAPGPNDGSLVNVLDQAWLPHANNPFISSDHPTLDGIYVQRLILPTQAKLLEKRVDVPLLCPFCQATPETVTHLLVDCAFARMCWTLVLYDIKAAEMCFVNWFVSILQSFPSAVICHLAMICWGIWRARNDLVLNNKKSLATVVVSSTHAYFKQWKLANVRPQDDNSIVNGVVEKYWSVPNEDTIKINVDASVFTSASFFRIGWIARDHLGSLIYVAAIRKQGRVDPVCAEAVGLKEGYSWIKT
uniref:Reverse transcriptase zinc-binding domain-containing protein n=1 Tax=Cannabis sativa TaxID=3483 RepID=A0A803QCK4_CANSA